jgi:hypothetical protein
MIAQKRGGTEALECGDLGVACIRADPSLPMQDTSRPITPDVKKQYLDAINRSRQQFEACSARTAAAPVCQSQERCWEPDTLP